MRSFAEATSSWFNSNMHFAGVNTCQKIIFINGESSPTTLECSIGTTQCLKVHGKDNFVTFEQYLLSRVRQPPWHVDRIKHFSKCSVPCRGLRVQLCSPHAHLGSFQVCPLWLYIVVRLFRCNDSGAHVKNICSPLEMASTSWFFPERNNFSLCRR